MQVCIQTSTRPSMNGLRHFQDDNVVLERYVEDASGKERGRTCL